MTTTKIDNVTVLPVNEQVKLSKEQQTFNRLIRQIEKKRGRLADWESAIPLFQHKYSSELLPLVDNLADMQTRLVHCLDRASEKKGLTKNERIVLTNLILEISRQLLANRDDAKLKAIYNRHSNSDYDNVAAESIESMKSMLSDVFGVDLGSADLNSPEDMLRHAQAQMEAKKEKISTKRQDLEERRARRKKSAKQVAREARMQAEEQQASLSIREIYRKLVSSLHPDREQDVEERQRKTILMQRVNEAYENKNLLLLLKLQLELEHIDQASINNIGEDRLKHYNRILKEQLSELDRELMHVEGGFMAKFGLDSGLSPDSIMHNLAADIVDIRQAIGATQEELLSFEDVRSIKAWIKKVKRQAYEMNNYDAGYF